MFIVLTDVDFKPDPIYYILCSKLHRLEPRYFKKGIAFKHKLSYSNYFGFYWPVVMSWD